jgi:hypothetical protein
MFSTMDRLWRGLAEEGAISQQEYQDTAFINYCECASVVVVVVRGGGINGNPAPRP